MHAVTDRFASRLASMMARALVIAGLLAVLAPSMQGQTPVQPLAALPSEGTPLERPPDWLLPSGGRYRLTPGDVLEVRFRFVPELDQSLTVQPDGYVALRDLGDVRLQGQTVPEARAIITEAYSGVVRDPVVSVVLKEFERPYFVAAGEVTRPGKYELRSAITLTQALAFAGGNTSKAKLSEVMMLRWRDQGWAVTEVNVKKMYETRDLSEDPLVRPGDTVYVPQSGWSKALPFIPRPGIGLYGNPF